MTDITLKHQLRQELSPQLLQSVRLLQMTSQELLDYLSQVREENPVIEVSQPLRREYEALRRRASWLDAGLAAHSPGEGREQGRRDRELESLHAFLLDQLDRMRLPKDHLAGGRYLVHLVDEDGYLDGEDLEHLGEKLPQHAVEEALATLQSLDPPGVGARDLAECLSLQLRRKKDPSPIALRVAEGFLPQLGRRHYGAIARALGVREEEVRAAVAEISALEPRPGRLFRAEEEPRYVRPDVFIVELEGTRKVLLNDYYLPRFTISDYYARLMQESEEPETRAYLKEKMRQAQWVLESLERRGSTLRRIAEAILEAQQPFFAGATWELVPMSMAGLAERLDLHPSTVTRAVQGKYLQCRRGTYPLKYFFSGAVGEGPSQQAVKCRMLELIKAEDPRHPLSDQALCDAFGAQGVKLARRTVAKYRTQLGVPAAAVRRKEERT